MTSHDTSGSDESHIAERPQVHYECEAYQLGIAIRNALYDSDLVTAFESLNKSIDRLRTGIQLGILHRYPFARWCFRSSS